MRTEEPVKPSVVGGLPTDLPIKRHFSRRHAVASIGFWAIMAFVFAPLAYQFSSRIQSTLSGLKGSPPEVVRENVVRNFSTALAFPTAVVWDAAGLPPDQADAAWKATLEQLRADDVVSEVTDGQVMVENWPSRDWHAAFVAVKAETYGGAEKLVPHLRDDIATLSYPGAHRPWVTGGPALFLDLNLASTRALRQGEEIALPITFIILLFVFRSPLAALLPVIVATLGVVCTLGAMSLFASMMSITFFVPNLVTMIGLGVGIDYCLIYLARYRRERANHLTTQEALQITRRTAGRTVIASAVLVISGFLTLLLIPLEFFTSIAVGGAFVVAMVSLATLTLLPAMIFLLGAKLEWGRLPVPFRRRDPAAPSTGERWGRLVCGRPWCCILLGLAILLVLAVPALRLRIASIEAKNLPAESEARQGYDSLNKNLGAGWMMPAIVLVQHPTADWMIGNGMDDERALVAQLNRLPNTQKIVTVTDTTGSRMVQAARMTLLTSKEEMTQNIILLLSRSDPQSPDARAWLDQVQQVLTAAEKAAPNGAHYSLGGLPSVTLSADRIILGALPRIIFVTLCSTFVLLALFMRSVVVAFKAIILNLICVLAAYGFQVLCFQDAWGARLFHLYPTDGLNTVVLVICFCALFGLSMDYEVFILSAVRESYLDQHDVRRSVQQGLLRVAGIITSAAIIMVSVFLSFAFGDVVEIEQLGVGLAFAILLDATIIRLLLVPSLLVVMGRWAFWCPGRALPTAERHHDRHGHYPHDAQNHALPVKRGP
jgi:RND superfamily putative drug exporter